jgi:5-methyltetrahydrofolate--homocysteine methyltransferase
MAGDLRAIWPWINPQALYGRHLGFRGRWETRLAEGDAKALELEAIVRSIQEEAEAGHMTARAVWQWFRVRSKGNDLLVLDAAGRTVETFPFQRQAKPDGLCIADWVRDSGVDWMGAFVTTVGAGIREWSESLKNSGEYLRSHASQALALEAAEGYAEMIHARMRSDWGFPDPEDMTMLDRFRSRYRGLRVSFGYPACPDLDHQYLLWRLLKPEQIGVQLTDGAMMDPEASVSALVFHHPDANYFGVGGEDARV